MKVEVIKGQVTTSPYSLSDMDKRSFAVGNGSRRPYFHDGKNWLRVESSGQLVVVDDPASIDVTVLPAGTKIVLTSEI